MKAKWIIALIIIGLAVIVGCQLSGNKTEEPAQKSNQRSKHVAKQTTKTHSYDFGKFAGLWMNDSQKGAILSAHIQYSKDTNEMSITLHDNTDMLGDAPWQKSDGYEIKAENGDYVIYTGWTRDVGVRHQRISLQNGKLVVETILLLDDFDGPRTWEDTFVREKALQPSVKKADATQQTTQHAKASSLDSNTDVGFKTNSIEASSLGGSSAFSVAILNDGETKTWGSVWEPLPLRMAIKGENIFHRPFCPAIKDAIASQGESVIVPFYTRSALSTCDAAMEAHSGCKAEYFDCSKQTPEDFATDRCDTWCGQNIRRDDFGGETVPPDKDLCSINGYIAVFITPGDPCAADGSLEEGQEITLAYINMIPGKIGDANHDGDCDYDDYPYFHACYQGEGVVVNTACQNTFDYDKDGDVDDLDFEAWDANLETGNTYWAENNWPDAHIIDKGYVSPVLRSSIEGSNVYHRPDCPVFIQEWETAGISSRRDFFSWDQIPEGMTPDVTTCHAGSESDPSGSWLYIAGKGSKKVFRMDTLGGNIEEVVNTSSYPYDIIVDDNFLYLSMSNLTGDGSIVSIDPIEFSIDVNFMSPDDTALNLASPSGFVFGGSDNDHILYVSDRSSNVIHKYNRLTGEHLGYLNNEPISTGVMDIMGMNSEIHVLHANGLITKYDSSGNVSVVMQDTELDSPYSFFLSDSNWFGVVDMSSEVIRRYDKTNADFIDEWSVPSLPLYAVCYDGKVFVSCLNGIKLVDNGVVVQTFQSDQLQRPSGLSIGKIIR